MYLSTDTRDVTSLPMKLPHLQPNTNTQNEENQSISTIEKSSEKTGFVNLWMQDA
jgi:hypothetical protein